MSYDIDQQQEELEDSEELEDLLQVTSMNDVVNALFDHIYNMQQFLAEHGYTQQDFKSWLKEYEKRNMN